MELGLLSILDMLLFLKENCYNYVWQIVAGVFFILVLTSLFSSGVRRSSGKKPVSAERGYIRGTGVDIPCMNPRTGDVFATRKAYTPQEVKDAYKRASIAQEEWSKTSFNERRAVLQDIIDWCVNHQMEIIDMSVRETGKTVTEASLGEVFTTCEKLRWIIAHGEPCIAPQSRPVSFLLSFVKKARVEFHPMGVIGLIVPWNYPFHNILSHVATALFGGNGCVCKSSEVTSFSSEIIEDMIRMILAKRGHNPDLVQVITGFGETGASLVQSGVDKVLFIGSPGVGKLVMRGASSTLTPVVLELGGKDPFVVFDDCDFDPMIEAAFLGAFINCGQNCIASERFYVQAGVYDKFVKAVSDRMKLIRTPKGKNEEVKKVDFGSMTMKQQVPLVQSLIQDAKEHGADVISGGIMTEGAGDGLLLKPTVLAGVTHDMRIANEETFGPCMVIMKFTEEDELVQLVNSTPYALGSSVFTTDYTKAERVGKQIKAGMLTINDFAGVPMVQSLPFGGVGESGFGAFNGEEGLRSFCRQKSVVTDRLPARTKLPGFLQYPQADNAHLIVNEGVKMVYGPSWTGSIAAFGRMMKLIMSSKQPAR